MAGDRARNKERKRYEKQLAQQAKNEARRVKREAAAKEASTTNTQREPQPGK